MMTNPRATLTLGDVVAAAFDAAARVSSDPREITRRARREVMHVLLQAGATSLMTACFFAEPPDPSPLPSYRHKGREAA